MSGTRAQLRTLASGLEAPPWPLTGPEHELVSGLPPESTEDRSQWHYQEGGAPFEVAVRFVQLIKEPDVALRLDEVRELVTVASWPVWQDSIRNGFRPGFLNELTGFLHKVRIPADDMAYVFWPITHPDQDEPFAIDKQQPMWMNIVTLLKEDGDWRVHQVGAMVPPQTLGRQPYSW